MSVPVSSPRPTAPPLLSPSIPVSSLSPKPLYNFEHLSVGPPPTISHPIRARQDSCGLTLPSNARTRAPFKPRSAARGTGSYQLRQFAEATLGSGSLQKAVKLPEGEDLNEWLAVNGEFAGVVV
ncbi:hypothetical protein PHISCL_05707 [Aspergillus sclerotialis]|uniref:Uncharacterized protein n=1 Tax=Aspergillus sclerotialis TaxID=2070753 RepID=A0A3A2ZVD4_9EURO|nr:hypothetical protein PHISCL_05707 [Aspergillus sclerotialis]